jgi:hypothetical protein
VSVEKIKVENHQELEQMIANEINQIEKGLTVICSSVPINEKTTLDILCHDSNGQLVIIQLDVNEDDIMLLQGIQSLDYVDKFKSFLKATYNKHKIDDKEKPRLILIAPSFSDAIRRAVEGLKGIRIDLYEWEYLKLGDHKGLRLQPIFAWKPAEKPKEEKPPEKKREPKKKEHAPAEKEETKPEPPKPEPKPQPESPKQPLMPPPQAEKPKEPVREEPKKKLKLF